MGNRINYYDSVEYDLYLNQCQISIFRTHQIDSVIYSGSQSQLFKLKSDQSESPLLIKAVSKNQNYKLIFDDLKVLSHKRLPKILETYETDKYYYIVKEYIAGVSLTQYVQKKTMLTEEETIRLVLQLIEVIKYLHDPARNIVYRDIKPDNIIIDHEDNVYLIDLETIRTHKKEQDSDTVAIVTKGYAAPEQYGYSQTDGRADIYSIGATLYYMLSGKALVSFWINNLDESKNLDKEFNKLSKKWRFIIDKCTKFNPDDRYENISKLEKDILMNNQSLLLQKVVLRVIQNKMSVLVIALLFILGFTYLNISNGGNSDLGLESRGDLTFERMLRLTMNQREAHVKASNDSEDMLSETEEISKLTTEAESSLHEDAAQAMEQDLKKEYEEKLRNVPIEMSEKSYSIKAKLSNIQVAEAPRVMIQVWDAYGNGNQTGKDSVDIKDGEATIECLSPVKALYLLDGYKYNFIAYIDNAPRNFNLDKGELYSKRFGLNYEGGMSLDLEFLEWELYDGGTL